MKPLNPEISRRQMLIGAGAAGALAALPLTGLRALAKAAPTIKTVEPGTILLGTSGDMPLVAERDGKLVGIDAELISLIADRIGLKPKIDLMDFPAILAGVPAGSLDWTGGNFSWRPKRAEIMALTDAVYYTAGFAIMKVDKPFTDKITISDLSGHSIGTGTGYSFIPDMKNVPKTTELKLYDSVDSCVRDIAAGRLDFGVLDAPVIDWIAKQDPSLGIKQVPFVYDAAYPVVTGKTPMIWGICPGEPDLFDALNQGIQWLKKTGQIGPIMAKYGITDPGYLTPPATPNPRLGVDRDAAGNVIGPFAHTKKDFSEYFK